jgi:copper(I)-binding protein
MTRPLILHSSSLSIALALGVVALSGCGSDDDSVQIENSWARTSAAGQTTGAVYFDLTVDEDDRLVGASVPASISADAQIHEVVMADMDDMHDGDAMDDMDDSGDMAGSDDMDDMDDMDMGAMTMQELVDGLALEGGQTVSFEPGGYHVMLFDLADPLEAGDEVELTLDFAEADSVKVTVEVAESAP